MKRLVVAILALGMSPGVAAQASRGRAVAYVDGKTVTVDYGQAHLGARSFDDLMKSLPADRVWRAGRDQITTITTEGPIWVGGTRIPAGRYSLYVPVSGDGTYSLAINKHLGVPLKSIFAGAPAAAANEPWPVLEDYGKNIGKDEVARVVLESAWTAQATDPFAITLEPTSDGGAKLTLAWGNRSLSTTLSRSSQTGTAKHFTLRVHYATDRRRGESSYADAAFLGSRAGALAFGVCDVTVPSDHRMGKVERPTIWRLEFRDNPDHHVVAGPVMALEKGPFLQSLADSVRKSTSREVLIFVHGYSVAFGDAIRRTAQLSYDLGIDGAPVLYSWASVGSRLGYKADEDAVEATKVRLVEFLSDVRRASGARSIYLVAHSMGNRALVGALDKIAASWPSLPAFKEVVLAAPDMDREVFTQLATTLRVASRRVTLYASSVDIPIEVSGLASVYPRAGAGGSSLVVVPGIESVDATGVSSDFLGHSYYGDNRSIVSDMFLLIRNGLPPEKRNLLPRSRNGLPYWEFRK